MKNSVQKPYEDLTCQVVHEDKLTKKFEVKTGVSQGCFLGPFPFYFSYRLKKTAEQIRNSIQRTLFDQLEDLDFADNVALLLHSHQQIQEKQQHLGQFLVK